MNTKAQDTVHAKHYKQRIVESMLYSKTRQESQALHEAGMRGEIMRHSILEGYRNDIKVVL